EQARYSASGVASFPHPELGALETPPEEREKIYEKRWAFGGISFMSQLIGTLMGIVIALAGGFVVYGLLKKFVGIRLDAEEEFNGADLSIHKISATPERESGW
ncbi:MAG: hypothetical protein Q7T25_12150, partial [Sideroxyarcus sp.]|nr:hypothetical protein [Sideroxyarcus sp.]